MTGAWYLEIARLIIVVAFCYVLGSLVGHPVVVITGGLLVLSLWHIQKAVNVLRFSRDPESARNSHGIGVWDEILASMSAGNRKHGQELKELEETLGRYRQAIRALPEGAIILGANDEIELFNHTAARILGLKEPDDFDRPITHLVREPRFIRFMEEKKFDDGLEIVHEKIPISVRIVPYGDLGKKLLLLRDMTRMLKLERMRRDFVANVSHEMKSPLTVIKGYVESLLDTAEKQGLQTVKQLRQVDLQTDRMCHIVEDLLQLSNLEVDEAVDKFVVVDTPSLIHSVCVEANEISAGGHKIVTDIDNQLMLKGDYNELYSAFSNIVLNAVTYTPDGGTIEGTWRLNEAGSPVFSVKDTGVGIGPEHIPRLTERFYRVDQARSRELGGTGLGLAIVKHVMIRHKAELRIKSKLNHGSVFSCIFPASSARSRDQKASNA